MNRLLLNVTLALTLLLGLTNLAQAMELHIFNPSDTAVSPTLELTCQYSSYARQKETVRDGAPIGLGTIPARGSLVFDINETGGIGLVYCGAVISSSTPIVAIAMSNEDNNGDGTPDYYSAAYNLASSGQTTLGVPGVYKNNEDDGSVLALMNIATQAAQITATYYSQQGGIQYQAGVNIPPGSTVQLGPDQEYLPEGFDGTTWITSDQEEALAGVKIKSVPVPDWEHDEMHDLYACHPDNAVTPMVHNQNSLFDGAHSQIWQMNAGDEDAMGTITYTNSDGSWAGEQTANIPVNGETRYDPAEAENLEVDIPYSTTLSNAVGDQPLPQSAEVRTVYDDDSSSSYSASPTGSTLHVPEVRTSAYGDFNLYVSNPGDAQVTYGIHYYDEQGNTSGSYSTSTLGPGESQRFAAWNIQGSAFQGSATIEADQPLAAVASYHAEDGTYAYNGIPGSENGGRAAATTLYAPYLLKNPSYTGWWWEGSDFSGTGISIENQGTNVYLAWYGYEDSGQAVWYSALMGPAGNDYVGDLIRYEGWPLSGNDPGTGYEGTVLGSATLYFDNTSEATLEISLSGVQRTKSLTRYWTGATDTRQINGWWYDPSHDGMGVFLEVRDETLFGAWYHYRDDESPRWWICLGDFAEGSTIYNGPWGEFSSGQTLTGEYQPATYVGEQGDMTLSFADASHATMTWGGNTYNLERFNFSGIGR